MDNSNMRIIITSNETNINSIFILTIDLDNDIFQIYNSYGKLVAEKNQ